MCRVRCVPKPHSSVEPQATPLSSVAPPPEKIDDGVVPGMNQKQQCGKEGEDDDLDYQNALDDEISQVIYKESLNEAVMNLALEEEHRNGHGWDEESSYLGGVGGESGIGKAEVNGEAWGGSDGEKGRSGNVGAMQGQYGNDGVEGEEEEEEEGDDGAEENSGFGGVRNYNKKQVQYPLRIDAEDCSFYMKTGNCKFGMNCKFNHPPKRRSQV